jgi:hypothetical protein
MKYPNIFLNGLFSDTLGYCCIPPVLMDKIIVPYISIYILYRTQEEKYSEINAIKNS